MKMFPPITPPQTEPEIRLVDNTFAPEILVTGVSGLSLMNGVVTITLESLHCDHSKNPATMERIVVARMTQPVAAAQALLVGLHQFLGQHGLSPLTAPEETRQ
jgi:hypothetical protein